MVRRQFWLLKKTDLSESDKSLDGKQPEQDGEKVKKPKEIKEF